jgi:peptide/nickel transport system substrate-binding protein
LTEAGWAKEAETWTKNGQELVVPIESFAALADVGPVVAEQLSRQGVKTSFATPSDFLERLEAGEYAALYGQGGSVNNDLYYASALYQSRSEAVPGGRPLNLSRWHDDAFDELVDQMALMPIDQEPQADPERLLDLWQQAMAIWLPELPVIQLLEWHLRIPMNQTYWTGWPNQANPYVTGAFWQLTFQRILDELRAAQ